MGQLKRTTISTRNIEEKSAPVLPRIRQQEEGTGGSPQRLQIWVTLRFRPIGYRPISADVALKLHELGGA